MNEPTLERTGPLATIRLNRPDKRNRIEPNDLTRLAELFDEVTAEPEIRVLVIASDGPSFCAGYHLGALAEGERPALGFSDVCDRLAALPLVTIARLAGNVHGGGTDLAMSCDLRLGATGIHLQMPAARLGLQYYATGLRRSVDRIGPAASKRIFCTGMAFQADELFRIGYLDEIHQAHELDGRIDQIVAAVSELAPQAVAATKAAIDGLADGTRNLDEVEESSRASMRSDEHKAAMAALRAQRQG